MSALEESYFEEISPRETAHLRVLSTPQPWSSGPSLALRRARREARLARRRRVGLGLVLGLATLVLAWPGHAFGGTTGTGLSTDLATSAVLASGEVYVVQSTDTINSIAALANPTDPSAARRALVGELHSDVVVAGEHVVIP